MSQACYYDPYCLGMCEWTGCPGPICIKPYEASKIEQTLPQMSAADQTLPLVSAKTDQTLPLVSAASSSSVEPALPSKRFKFSSEEELKELSKGYTPANTSKATQWALNVFKDWKQERNTHCPLQAVPEGLLTASDPEILNTHLARLAVEAKKANGESYPPATVYQLLCGILRYMREKNPNCPNFMDKKDGRFKPLQATLDSLFHKLHSQGIGIQVKHAEIFTKEDEGKLWDSGVLGYSNPKSLLNAAFYVVGKFFALRGGNEHRNLRLSQLRRESAPDKYVYHENVSKNTNGSFKNLHIKPKIVPLFACPEAGDRCPVTILDKYITKLPVYAQEQDLFYLRPLPKVPVDPSLPWYAKAPVGRDSLNKTVKKMCQEAKIEGNKTNHSLRATGATQLYERGVPEKQIQERTGHRSLEALRVYERTSEAQHRAATSVLCESSVKRARLHSVKEKCQVPSSGVSFSNLYGCTININAAPGRETSTSQSEVEKTELEFDSVVSSIMNSEFH